MAKYFDLNIKLRLVDNLIQRVLQSRRFKCYNRQKHPEDFEQKPTNDKLAKTSAWSDKGVAMSTRECGKFPSGCTNQNRSVF